MAKETHKQQMARLKDEYLGFYSELPVQRAAADFIGRDEDTIIKWRHADKAFADAVTKAKSDWARKNFNKTKPDTLLARLCDDLKPIPQELDVTTHDVRNPDALNRLAESAGFVPAASKSNNDSE